MQRESRSTRRATSSSPTRATRERILVFDANGGYMSEWASSGEFGEGPRDVAVAPDNTVYVAFTPRSRCSPTRAP